MSTVKDSARTRAVAAIAALGVLLTTAACGSGGTRHGAAPTGYPATFKGAPRVAQVIGDEGQTSVTLRFTPTGTGGAGFAYCIGAPKGTKVLLASGTGWGFNQQGDWALPCSSGFPKHATGGFRKMPWYVLPRAVGRPLVLHATLVTTHVNEDIEDVVAKPVKAAPHVRIVAAVYQASSKATSGTATPAPTPSG